jgi:hypothetical protein
MPESTRPFERGAMISSLNAPLDGRDSVALRTTICADKDFYSRGEDYICLDLKAENFIENFYCSLETSGVGRVTADPVVNNSIRRG